MPTLNSKTYEMQYLKREEKAVVDAMRMGADIQVRFAALETYQEVDEAFSCFDAIEAKQSMNIYDVNFYLAPFVAFDRNFNGITVLASLKTGMELKR